MRYVLTVKRFFDKGGKYSSVEAKINPQTSAFQYLNTGLGISYQSFFFLSPVISFLLDTPAVALVGGVHMLR